MRDRFISRPVVLIADCRTDYPLIDVGTDDLDLYTRAELDEILRAIRAVCRNVTSYEDPPTFIEHISSHRNAVILPFWAGHVPATHSMVAAVEEAYGLEVSWQTLCYIIGQDQSPFQTARSGVRLTNSHFGVDPWC